MRRRFSSNVKFDADCRNGMQKVTLSNVLSVPDLVLVSMRSASNEVMSMERASDGFFRLSLGGKQVLCTAYRRKAACFYNIDEWGISICLNVHFGLWQLGSISKKRKWNPMFRVQHFSVKSGSRTGKVLELLLSDRCGTMENALIGGSCYFLTFIDILDVRLFPEIESTWVRGCFQDLKPLLENQKGKRIKRLRTDNDTEYVNGFLLLGVPLVVPPSVHSRIAPEDLLEFTQNSSGNFLCDLSSKFF